MDFEQAVKIKGKQAPRKIIDQLELIEVEFVDFSGRNQTGQMIIHKELAKEVRQIFKQIRNCSFPIEMISLAGDNTRPDTTNNTASFNYRKVAGTDRLSQHSFGRAIDINPLLNPYFGKEGVSPKYASYDPTKPGTLTKDSPVVKIFEARGWVWLGREDEYRDYMHFEKPA